VHLESALEIVPRKTRNLVLMVVVTIFVQKDGHPLIMAKYAHKHVQEAMLQLLQRSANPAYGLHSTEK
jgi:hypothetical protein